MTPPLMHGSDWQGENPTGWIVTEKFDGFRAFWDGARLLTREGADYNAPDWFTAPLPGFPIDCELYAGPGNRAALNGANRWRDRERWRGLRLMVFDSPGGAGGYTRRVDALAEAWRNRPDHAVIVARWACQGVAGLRSDFARIRARGGEGAVLRHPSAPYEPARVRTLLKVLPHTIHAQPVVR